jgi:3-oxoacyl-[acyl-carrier-protein] synthase II
MQKRRVVITGTGLITPLGHNAPDSWAAIKAGQSGIGSFTLLEPRDHEIKAICEVKEFDADQYLGRKEARRRDRFQQFAAVAANEALAQSGLAITDDNRQRIGVILGTGVGGIRTLVDQDHIMQEKGVRRVSPFSITMIMPNGASGMIAIDHGIQGPTHTVSTACASGNDAIGNAYIFIRAGLIDAALTGGTESILANVALAGFERAGATL